MQFNRTNFYSLINNYDFLENQTNFCPLKSSWIYFEEYFFTLIGLILICLLTIKIHLTEKRFHNFYALIRCYIMSLTLSIMFLASIPYHFNSIEWNCLFEQILLQYSSIICLTNIFLISLLRLIKLKSSSICFIFISLIFIQTFITCLWFYIIFSIKHRTYSRIICYHHLEIHLCLHDYQPFIFSTLFFPINFILTSYNVYYFTRPFAIAQFLEAIISSIGLILAGCMWYMSLLVSNYPQVPYRYVAYVILLTYMLPRIWISELEHSRITIEEIKPLLHEEIQYRNENCRIRFNDDDEEEEEEEIHCQIEEKSKPMIRTIDMSPGEIFSSILDKYDSKSNDFL